MSESVVSFVERVAPKEYPHLMPKPTVIDVPYPTLDEIARTYGKQLERQLEELLNRSAANGSRSRRRAAATASRASRKK